jgi:DNA-binding NarL/FixJ family response regulator
MNKFSDLGLDAINRGGRQHGSFDYDVLSPREREVMLFATKGFANKQIARELGVTEGTVKLHLHRIYQKLGIKSRFALAVLAKKSQPKPNGDPSDAV